MVDMKVLVLGGTGAMGAHLIQLLSNEGIETVVTSRRNRDSSDKIRFIKGNAHNIEFLKSVLVEKWDVIVDFMVYTTLDFKERSDMLLQATSQYVFLSSARVYADSKQPITEKSPRLLDVSKDEKFLATDEYSLSKARQEDILRNSGQKNWTIIRPYITYSKNRLQLGVLEKEEWLFRALNGRSIVFSNDIKAKLTTLTYGLDVARGIRAIMGESNAFGEAFHITTKDSKSWEAILNIYLEVLKNHLGYKPKVIFQDLEKFFAFKPAKYQVIFDRLFDRQFDSTKIDQYVNLNTFTESDIGIRSCLDEFLKDPEFLYINWKLEAIKDRQSSEHTPLKEVPGIKNKVKYLIARYFA